MRSSWWSRLWHRTRMRIAKWCISGTGWELTWGPLRGTSGLNEYARICHQASVDGGWWHNIHTGEPLQRNQGELFMLMVSEIAEAMEGVRKSLMDDKLPHRRMVEVEMADLLIRAFDYCGAKELPGGPLDIDGALMEKMAFNAMREDHKKENRLKADGKKF